jgi:Fe-S cluster biogenesis protein NfuA
MEQIISVTVYAEMTPNPVAMKFVADIVLVPDGAIAEFNTADEARGYSSLASALFQFPFVKHVFMTGNFVTVIRTDSIEWDYITMELREFIRDYLRAGKPVIERIPELVSSSESGDGGPDFQAAYEPNDLDEPIMHLLEEFVRPAVEGDGGSIHYKGFKDGRVTVVMRGSCAGCPSSTATLKGGIENLLKSHLPEVKEVVAEAM